MDKIIPAFIKKLASESAKIINPLFADPNLKVELKADQTPVTYADRKAEEVMRFLIEKEFPDHGIIGEEHGSTRPEAEFTWVLDPIDGTISFTSGCPLFGTLISLRRNGQPIWGAINHSAIGRLYLGNNRQCWCNDRLTTVRVPPPVLRDCFLMTTDPKSSETLHHPPGWRALYNATGRFRTWGDCFGYSLLAAGTIDIMCDPEMNLWDIDPLIPVLRGAGATVTDWYGHDPVGANSIVAAHPDIHQKVIALLAGDQTRNTIPSGK